MMKIEERRAVLLTMEVRAYEYWDGEKVRYEIDPETAKALHAKEIEGLPGRRHKVMVLEES